jgi:hypothetical protein
MTVPERARLTLCPSRHFFQVAFKHVIQEQQKRRSSPFSLSKTMSRVTPSSQPLSALKKRFSTINKDDPAPPDTVKVRSRTYQLQSFLLC